VELQHYSSRRNPQHAGHQAVSLHSRDCLNYGKSRQLVFVYLEALASIGMAGIICSGYKVLSREGILKLGTFIPPGILGKMRIESGIKPKPKMRKTAA